MVKKPQPKVETPPKRRSLRRIPILLFLVSLGVLCICVVKWEDVTISNVLYGDLHHNVTIAFGFSNTSNNISNIFASTRSRVEDFVGSLFLAESKVEDVDFADYEYGLVLHYFDKDILDLLDWEERSLVGMMGPNATSQSTDAACMPPKGILRSCCLGSYSKGGGTTDVERIRCAESLQPKALEALQRNTRRFFDENALPTKMNTMECDVCRILNYALMYNLTIALIGDSMQHQIIDGLSCELQRRNYNVTTEVIEHHDPTQPYQSCSTTVLLHVKSLSWRHNQTVTVEFHRIYVLPLINHDLSKITANVDVLVLGFGLHYAFTQNNPDVFHSNGLYITAMRDLFRNVTKQGRVKLLVHRETSAQHFDSDGGEYSLWARKNENNRSNECLPFKRNDTSVGWREKAIRIAANESGHKLVISGSNMPRLEHPSHTLQEVLVLPYFNFTSQHHDMHPRSPVGFQDCTHYCSSPFVYYPMWRSLRLAMERQFARQK